MTLATKYLKRDLTLVFWVPPGSITASVRLMEFAQRRVSFITPELTCDSADCNAEPTNQLLILLE